MGFTTVTFVFFFLPAFLLLLFVFEKMHLPNCVISAFITFVSLVFCAWSGLTGLITLLVMSLINYLLCIKVGNSPAGKLWLKIGVAWNLLILVGFKYTYFFLSAFFRLFSKNPPDITIPDAPLGLSFFTFLFIACLADIYKKKAPVPKNILLYLEYVFFFPKVVMGPITRLGALSDPLTKHQVNVDIVHDGVFRFCWGFSKKVLLADQMAVVADEVFSSVSPFHPLFAWIGIISYTLQIYLDFSAYTDMAIGLGSICGLTLPENFNEPYLSKSVKEFWRRWHISLSSWFRDYVYIPLGGNRKGSLITCRNLMIVFLLTGLWHGASWKFVFWGIYYGIFLLLERTRFGTWLGKLPNFIQHLYAMLVVMVGWVFFRADSLAMAFQYIQFMFGFGNVDSTDMGLKCLGIIKTLTPHYFFYLLISVLICMPVIKKLWKKIQWEWLQDMIALLIFILALCYMAASSYNPFIYMRF